MLFWCTSYNILKIHQNLSSSFCVKVSQTSIYPQTFAFIILIGRLGRIRYDKTYFRPMAKCGRASEIHHDKILWCARVFRQLRDVSTKCRCIREYLATYIVITQIFALSGWARPRHNKTTLNCVKIWWETFNISFINQFCLWISNITISWKYDYKL